jgi:hypothetical protein
MALGLGTLGKVGKTMMNAPGMGPIRKPLAKGMQATPGLKGIGKGIGLGPSKVRPPSTVGEPLGPINGPQQSQPRPGIGGALQGAASAIGNRFGNQMQRPSPQMGSPGISLAGDQAMGRAPMQQPGYMGGQQLQDAMGAGQPVQDDQQAQIQKMLQMQQQMGGRNPMMGGGFGMRRPMPFQRGMMGQGMGLGPRQPMMQNMMQPMQMQQQEPEMY